MLRVSLLLPLFLFLITSCEQQTQDDQHAYDDYRPFRVTVSQQVPVNIITKMPDGTYNYQGIASYHFYYIAQKIKRTLVVVVPNEEDMEKYGRTQASFNQVVNGEADISAMVTDLEPEHLNLVDVTYPTAMSLFKMLVPAAKEESRLFAFIRPFQPMVWLFLFVSLIGSIIAVSGLDWISLRLGRQQQRNRINQAAAHVQEPVSTSLNSYLIKYCMYTIGIMTSHASSNPFTRNSLRIFGSLWLLVMTVLVYAYSGLLVGCLTVPAMIKPIETLEDVAASTEVVLYINPTELSGFGKAEGKTGIWKALGDQMRRRPDGLYKNSIVDADFSVEHQNYATPHLPNILTWMMRKLYKKEKICRFHLTNSIPFSVRFHYVLHKGDEANEKINLALMDMRENGLLDYYSNEVLYVPGSGGSEQCFKNQKSAAKDTPIKLVDLTSAFFVLGIGLGLSILCFLIELIVSKYKKEMQLRNTTVIVPIIAVPAAVNVDQHRERTQLVILPLGESVNNITNNENDVEEEIVTEIF